MLNFLIVDQLIKDGLMEDMPFGDVTTNSIISESSTCSVSLYAKEDGIICGLTVFNRVFELLGDVTFSTTFKDSDTVTNGQKIGELSGNTRKVLMGERIALNLLQRMSGIATTTKQFSNAIAGTNAKVVDTTKYNDVVNKNGTAVQKDDTEKK